MTNKTITATDAKNSFADLVDMARIEPITITRNHKAVAIVLSPDEYTRLVSAEDKYWGDLADRADRNSLLSPEDSQKLLNNIINAKNTAS